MKKYLILYESIHHGNTARVIKGIQDKFKNVDLIKSDNFKIEDLPKYNSVGFASGIYGGKLHKKIRAIFDNVINREDIKKIFFIYTSSSGKSRYIEKMGKKIKDCNKKYLGAYGCKGYDTFGPFKWIGGLAKGRPNQDDLDKSIYFFKNKIENK